jgi:hypothetical protein
MTTTNNAATSATTTQSNSFISKANGSFTFEEKKWSVVPNSTVRLGTADIADVKSAKIKTLNGVNGTFMKLYLQFNSIPNTSYDFTLDDTSQSQIIDGDTVDLVELRTYSLTNAEGRVINRVRVSKLETV